MKICETLTEFSQALQQNQVGLFPCDTIWGLVGLPSTHAKICTIKQRSLDLKMIHLVGSLEQAIALTAPWTPAQTLWIRQVWPGPVSVILPAREGGTIGVRFPEVGPIRDLLDLIQTPLLSTSANLSGYPYNREISTLDPQIQDAIDWVYTQAEPSRGTPSPILDLTGPFVRLIRAA